MRREKFHVASRSSEYICFVDLTLLFAPGMMYIHETPSIYTFAHAKGFPEVDVDMQDIAVHT